MSIIIMQNKSVYCFYYYEIPLYFTMVSKILSTLHEIRRSCVMDIYFIDIVCVLKEAKDTKGIFKRTSRK